MLTDFTMSPNGSAATGWEATELCLLTPTGRQRHDCTEAKVSGDGALA